MKKIKKNRGLVKAILVIVVALIILGYFGYNLRTIINSPTVHDNLVYVWGLIVKVWNTVLARPALWLWDHIVVDLIWNNMQKILHTGAPELMLPQ